MLVPDSKELFNESYLREFPERIGIFHFGNEVINNIKDRIKIGQTPIELDTLCKGLRKIGNGDIIYYWIENTKKKILLSIELERTVHCWVVNMVSKTSATGKPPYASELYQLILQDQKSQNVNTSIRLSSDRRLSDDGYAVWERLFNSGLKISVYDNTDPGKTFISIDSLEDLKKYFTDDKSSQKWQYLLTESIDQLGDTISRFNRYRLLELSGL